MSNSIHIDPQKKRMIQEGKITVNEKIVACDYKLKSLDVIQFVDEACVEPPVSSC